MTHFAYKISIKLHYVSLIIEMFQFEQAAKWTLTETGVSGWGTNMQQVVKTLYFTNIWTLSSIHMAVCHNMQLLLKLEYTTGVKATKKKL